MNATEATQVEIVGQVIDNSHGGSPFTGDWLFPVVVVCWPISVPCLAAWLLWIFFLESPAKKFWKWVTK